MKTKYIFLIAVLFVMCKGYCQKEERDAEGKERYAVRDNQVTIEIKRFSLVPANDLGSLSGHRCPAQVVIYQWSDSLLENEYRLTDAELKILLGRQQL